MSGPYLQLTVEQVGDVWCLRFAHPKVESGALEDVLTEIDQLTSDAGVRKVVFSLGPEEPQCLYSIFLAKLVSLQKRLKARGGALKLAEASEDVQEIFEACRLRELFDFVPDRNAAIAALAANGGG